MKKIIAVIPVLIFLLVISGCGTRETNSLTPSNKVGAGAVTSTPTSPSDQIVFQGEVLQNDDILLVAPDKNSNEFKSSDKIVVRLDASEIFDSKGNSIKSDTIKVGDMLEITYNGVILESYPAQIGALKVKVLEGNPVVDAYLAMIDDIYKVDSGLNGDISIIALNTKDWTGLNEKEKLFIFDKVKEKYQVEVIESDFDDLKSKGYIDDELFYFKDGILITISKVKINPEKTEITYGIEKWRSGDGAIGTDQATAKFKDGQWVIQNENMWIS